ncbi:glycosyltransferase, partial [bacterium]
AAALGDREFVLRSVRRPLGSARVLVLDTYGELKEAYASADLAVVGGTYGIDHGGHTPVEAIAWGVPTLVGPNHRQHVQTVEWLVEAGAAFVFHSPEELASLMIGLSQDSAALSRSREAARRLADEREDPTLRVYDALIAPAM